MGQSSAQLTSYLSVFLSAQGTNALLFEIDVPLRKIKCDKVPCKESQSKPVRVFPLINPEPCVGLAIPNTFRKAQSSEPQPEMHKTCWIVPLNDTLFDNAVNIVPGIDQQVGAGSAQQTNMLNKWDAIVLTCAGKHGRKVLVFVRGEEREGFAAVGGIYLVDSQKAHLSGLKIHLDAVVTQAVHAQDPHNVLMRTSGEPFERIARDVSIGHQPGVAQVELGRRIKTRFLFRAGRRVSHCFEAVSQFWLQGFVQERDRRARVDHERQLFAALQPECHHQPASTSSPFVHRHFGGKLRSNRVCRHTKGQQHQDDKLAKCVRRRHCFHGLIGTGRRNASVAIIWSAKQLSSEQSQMQVRYEQVSRSSEIGTDIRCRNEVRAADFPAPPRSIITRLAENLLGEDFFSPIWC